mmetsp:Transcript_111036/g.347418  ORF Transcript_111036/g.347418 Transcript_111036/m.347418 type:complete len:457 (-) Transcript_111036:14-1384(-)
MGRLRCAAVDGGRPEHQSLAALDEWQLRPDLCILWVAFCAPSTLTLADGVRLAKTRRCSSKVLGLLAGIGLSGSEPEPRSQRCGEAEPTTMVISKNQDQQWRTSRRGAGQAEVAALCSVEAAKASFTNPSRACVGSHGLLPACPPHFQESCCRPRARAALNDPCDTNLAYFRHCTDVAFEPWVPGDFALVSRLAKSAHGELRCLRARDGTHAVAKIVPNSTVEQAAAREANERRAWLAGEEALAVEDLRSEVAVLAYLQRSFEQCPFLIRLLGAFQDESSVYLLTEYCEGGELFERVACGLPLSEDEKKRYVFQLLQALRHLHGHNVGHRDVSLENVLLRQGSCVLMDFGQAVRLRGADGVVLRYFAEAGKRLYRAPEMYVPGERPVQVVCPADGMPGGVVQVAYDRCRCEVLLPPDAVPSRPCAAEPHGYAAAPADVFACGVCAFVLLVGKPPWS